MKIEYNTMNNPKSPEQRAADILLKGGKMLSLACPICSSPIYQTKEGETICVVCSRPVKIVSKEELENMQTSKAQDRTSRKEPSHLSNKNKGGKHEVLDELSVQPRVQRILYNKLDFILDRIEKESDLGILSQLLDVLEQILSLIQLAHDVSV